MAYKTREIPTLDYEKCVELLKGRAVATIAPNTTLTKAPHGVDVALHGHTIAEFHADGTVWLSSAGYATATTRKRLACIAPVPVRIRDFSMEVCVDGDWQPLNRAGVTLTPAPASPFGYTAI